jgi:hypothetical protein
MELIENNKQKGLLTREEGLNPAAAGIWDDGSIDTRKSRIKQILTTASLSILTVVSPSKDVEAHNLDKQSYTTTTIKEGLSEKVDGFKIFNNLSEAEIRYNNAQKDLKFEGKKNFAFYSPALTGDSSPLFKIKSKKIDVKFEIGRHGQRVALMPDERLMDLPQDTIVQADIIGGIGIVILEKGTQVVVKKYHREGEEIWDVEEIAACNNKIYKIKKMCQPCPPGQKCN